VNLFAIFNFLTLFSSSGQRLQ